MYQQAAVPYLNILKAKPCRVLLRYWGRGLRLKGGRKLLSLFRNNIINQNLTTMKWYHYIACFFAGLFLANTVPHFIHGISGDKFPTPFSNPPGKGLSSPTVNVLWALFNLIVGYLLYRAGKISKTNTTGIIILFLGIVAMSILLSIGFADKMTQ
jgi:hypothetical protein